MPESYLSKVPRNIQSNFVDFVKSLYESSKDSCYDKHEAYIEFLELWKNDPVRGRPKDMANVPVPVIKEATNATLAEMSDKLFTSNGLDIDAVGQEENDTEAASANADLIRYQSRVRSLSSKLRTSLFDYLLAGMAPAKVVYRRYNTSGSELITLPTPAGTETYTRPTTKVSYEGAEVIPIDPLDFFPHPEMTDMDDDLGTLYRFEASEQHLIGRQLEGTYENVSSVLQRIKDAKKEGGAISEGTEISNIARLKKDRRTLLNLRESAALSNKVTCYEYEGPYDIDGDGEDENVIGVIADIGTGILLRLEESPYHHGKKSVICGRMFTFTNEFWATGLADAAKTSQAAATSLLNCILDSYYKLSRRRTFVREGALLDEKELDIPWGNVHVYDDERPLNEMISPEQPLPVGPDALPLFQTVLQMGQMGTRIQDTMAGRSPGGKQSATLSSQLFQQGSVTFKDMLMRFEDTYIKPMCDLMMAINQQFLTEPYIINIIGRNGVFWKRVAPEEIAGKVHFLSLASTKNVDRSVHSEQIMRAMQIAQRDPALASVTPLLFIQLMDTWRMPNLQEVKTLIGYPQMLQQLRQAFQMGLTPHQYNLFKSAQLGQPPPENQSLGGNFNQYGSPQANGPTDQEQLLSSVRASQTANLPTA